MVPMHLGLIDGPFESHNLISTQESLFLYQSSRWLLDLKSECPLGPRKEPRYTFSHFSKIPANEPSPGSPIGLLWNEIPIYRAFCIFLKNLIKIPLNKKALRKKRPSMFPKSGAPMEADSHF